jgi:hypothetical protein
VMGAEAVSFQRDASDDPASFTASSPERPDVP